MVISQNGVPMSARALNTGNCFRRCLSHSFHSDVVCEVLLYCEFSVFLVELVISRCLNSSVGSESSRYRGDPSWKTGRSRSKSSACKHDDLFSLRCVSLRDYMVSRRKRSMIFKVKATRTLSFEEVSACLLISPNLKRPLSTLSWLTLCWIWHTDQGTFERWSPLSERVDPFSLHSLPIGGWGARYQEWRWPDPRVYWGLSISANLNREINVIFPQSLCFSWSKERKSTPSV